MSEPIRILYWGMTDNLGGIESFIIEIYRNLDKSKVQIDFITSHDHPKLAYEDEITAMGGHIYRVMYSKRESIIKSKICLKKFFSEHPEIKGIHVHANFLYADLLKQAKKSGIPLRILHSHNSSGSLDDKSLNKRLRNILVRKQISKYPNEYFACSDLAARFMFKESSYKWIKNGVDIERFRFKDKYRQEIRKELGIGEKCKVLGFVGRLCDIKNPIFVIDIYKAYLKKNSNAILVIVGTGVLEKEVKQYAKDLISEGKVKVLGRRTDTEKIYMAMDVFLLPSIFEGLPVVLVEAQTSGVMTLCSDTITKQVRVTDRIKYCSINVSADVWADNIDDLLKKSDDNREKYADQVRTAGFDMRDVAKEIEKIYLQY